MEDSLMFKYKKISRYFLMFLLVMMVITCVSNDVNAADYYVGEYKQSSVYIDNEKIVNFSDKYYRVPFKRVYNVGLCSKEWMEFKYASDSWEFTEMLYENQNQKRFKYIGCSQLAEMIFNASQQFR